MSDQLEYIAKIGNQYIHESLSGLTPNKAWAWKPTRDQLKCAESRYEILEGAKILPIIEVKLQTGAMQ